MSKFRIPYGKGHLSFSLPDGVEAEVVVPPETPAAPDPAGAVEAKPTATTAMQAKQTLMEQRFCFRRPQVYDA